MGELLVGCPILLRAWAVPAWFLYVQKACATAGLRGEYVFVGDPVRDPDTWSAIRHHADAPVHAVVVEEYRDADVRDWGAARFERMATLRNALLGKVRRLAPELFLSLDSDILIHPDALANMAESLDQPLGRFGAVGAKCYMEARGTRCPSYAMLAYGAGLLRSDAAGVFPVDVIMAAKLMTPPAYAVDYRSHSLGEDIGWSIEARKAGVVLGWDGRVASKHVMSPEALEVMDPRVGY